MFTPRRLRLVLAAAFACGPEPAATTTVTTTATTTGLTDGGHSVTGEPSTSTAITTSGESTAALTTTTTAPTTTTPASTGGFIVVPDIGHFGCAEATVRTTWCDPWVQNCGPGQKCVPWSGGCDSLSFTRCIDVVRDPVGLGGACLVEGDPLSGRDNCDFGLLCAHVDPDTLAGTCLSLCKGAPDLPDCTHDPGTWCVEFNPDEYLGGLCLPTCDPLAQTSPPRHKGPSCPP